MKIQEILSEESMEKPEHEKIRKSVVRKVRKLIGKGSSESVRGSTMMSFDNRDAAVEALTKSFGKPEGDAKFPKWKHKGLPIRMSTNYVSIPYMFLDKYIKESK